LDGPCCPRDTGSCSAGADFVMSPIAQPGDKVFSPCTIGNICSLMGGSTAGRVETSCLSDPDPNRQTIGLAMCGNGIVESGEQCDPGVGIESVCCDTATCQFKGNAACDPESSPCCTDSCTFAPATQMCRPSVDEACDAAEMCTGNSSACPADVTTPNGQACGDGDLKCASGQCTSVSLQCRTIGAAMGLTEACPDRGDNSCEVSCQDPESSNRCIRLQALLIDGSPCGFGGTCSAGKCQATSPIESAKAWYAQNLQIAIPVTIVAGLVVLLILWAIFKAVRRCLARRKAAATIVPPPPIRSGGFGYGYEDRTQGYERPPRSIRTPGIPSVLQPGTSASYSRLGDGPTRSNWVDETMYNGPRRQ
jgi:hypothetical protein